MASSVKGNYEKVNGAVVNPLEGPKVYIGRRTGAVIKINARKDSNGFDRIEDYFPDSESEDEENKSSTDVKPIKLKPNQFIGRRTGALIEINARKDSHGFHLIEDYFPDSITESDISMASNKANKKSLSMNKSTASKLEKTFESNEENQEEQAIENQDGEDQLIEPEDNSHVASVSKEKKDFITPQEKEAEISPNLTGTAVKNSAASCEPTPQFFGSKKRLFPSTEIVDITRDNKDEPEEDIDIVGISDEEEEGEKGTRVSPCNQVQTKNQAPAATQREKETAKDDTLIVDVDGDESPCVFLDNSSKRSNVKDAGDVQKEKEVCIVESKDDSLIVDIDDKSTFVTLGNKSKDTKVKNLSHSDLVPEEEVSYQMDESVILEGTKHKVMSPEFGGVSNHASRSSGVEDEIREEEVAKSKGRMARKSNKQTTKKGVKEQEGTEDKNDDQGDINFKQKSRKSTKSVQNKSGEQEVDENQENVAVVSVNVTDVDPVKKPTRKSKKSVPNKNSKEKQEDDENREDGADVSLTLSRLNQTSEDDKAVNPSKNGSRRSKKSLPNKSSKEEQEDDEKEEDGADISVRLGQTTEDNKAVKKGSRKSKKSISKRSLKEKQEEQEQEIQGETKTSQNTGDDESDKKNAKRKSIRKTQKEQDGSPADANEEDLEHVVQGEAKASNKTEDEKSDKKNPKRKSTRKIRKEQDGDASEGEKEQPEERVMTRRATRSNASKLASTTFNSLIDLTLNKTKTKKTEAPKTRSTRSKNKSMVLEKDGGSKESENEENKTAGSHETLEEDDDENQIMATEREEDLLQEMEMNDTAVRDTQLTKDGGYDDSTGKKGQENKSTSEIYEPEVVDDGDDDDLDGDDEQESQEISKKPRKNGQKSNGRKSKSKGRRLTASTNQSASDSSHDDEGGDDDDDDDNDEDGEEDDGNENTKNDSRNISKNAKNKYNGSKKSITSNSASDSDKGSRVNKRGRPRKTKHRSKVRLTLPRPMARKSSTSDNKTTENDVIDQKGMADEDDSTKAKKKQPEDVALENDETVNKSINISSRKRTNGTRVDSLRVPESTTPAINNDSPNVLPPSSVKSILKSSITKTQSTDTKKRRVSIAANRKGSDAANDDDNSGNPNRLRKSSVSFAPTQSFRISPDDFSTPEESPGKLAKLSFVTNYSGFTSEDNTFTPGDVPSASLASSVSSVASNSISGSDSSCVNDSKEITISSTKRRQIAEDEGKDDSGFRRSKRTKVPALQYWKNERIKYERRQSGWFVSGIEKVPTPKVVKRKPSKKPKKEKKRGTTRNEHQEEDSEDFIDVPADMEEVRYTAIPVVNPDNGEQVELDLVHTPEMLNFVNTSRKSAQPDDLLIMDKYMSHNLFGAGQIILRPGAEKGKQHVRDDTMVFYVVKGRLEVTVHESTVFLRTGSTFFVPTGNWYNIKNVESTDARLLFVQIKG